VEGDDDDDDPARETVEVKMQVNKDIFFTEGIIELIILNKRIAPDLAIRRWYTVVTSPADRSRLNRQRDEAVEGRGHERWMNAIDVTVLSAPSI
jgi:hypothetical protein